MFSLELLWTGSGEEPAGYEWAPDSSEPLSKAVADDLHSQMYTEVSCLLIPPFCLYFLSESTKHDEKCSVTVSRPIQNTETVET